MVTVLALALGSAGARAATPVVGGLQASASVIWGPAREVPGLAALNTGGAAQVLQVTCPQQFDCVAAGTYQDSKSTGNSRGFVTEAVNGQWSTAHNLLSGPYASISGLSCAPSGPCTGTAGSAAETENVSDGSWSGPQPIPLSPESGSSAASLGVLSCTSAGNCAAGGSYEDASSHYQALVADEKNGTWGPGEEVPGTGTLNAGGEGWVYALSCASDGNCAAGGSYWDVARHDHAYVADETAGTWGTAVELPGIAALEDGGSSTVKSISCGAPGDCAAVGTYTESSGLQSHAFVADETNGSWGDAIELPGSQALDTVGRGQLWSVSCTAAGECAAGGTYLDNTGLYPLVDDESGGTWGTARALPAGTIDNTYGAFVTSLSCASAGNCTAGGYYTDAAGHDQAMLISETGGTWGAPFELPGTAALNKGGVAHVRYVSCTSAGGCAAGGFYEDSAKQQQAFIATTVEPTTTAITLTAPTVTYGNEQAATISVSVSAQTLAPAGSVTVSSGSQQVCVIPLASGADSCTVPATSLPPGTATLTAAYPGAGFLSPSTSPTATLHINAAPSATTLTLSAGKVTYGHEQGERATITVAARYGLPATGNIALKAGKTVLCTVALAAGQGSCTLSAARLPAGNWHFTAAYPGTANITASSSTPVTLTVGKASTATALTLSTAKVRHGHEGTEHLTVTVKAQYGQVPGTKVTIKTGKTALCTITLAAGKGTCLLTPSQLRTGTYTLTVTYPGTPNYAASTSAKKALTVTR